MQLRFVEDRRALIWVFIFFPGVPLAGYLWPQLLPLLVPLGLYLAYCAGVLTHNHLHSPVFRGAFANEAYSAWLSFFYGCPVFTWIPTHNGNHHRFINGEGDVTRTTRHSARNTLLAALSYPLRSALWQAGGVARFVRRARRHNARRLRQIGVQSAVVLFGHPLLLLALLLDRGGAGIVLYTLLVGIPALFAPWAMMFTNYLQHVDCDPASPDDHSRNFVNAVWNWFVFDAGYHTVHHEHPAQHWSRYRALHAARAERIDPRLNASTPLAFCATTYLLEPLARAFGVPTITLRRR